MKIIGKTEYIDRTSRPTDNVERDFSSFILYKGGGRGVRRGKGAGLYIDKAGWVGTGDPMTEVSFAYFSFQRKVRSKKSRGSVTVVLHIARTG